jgi:hypothetical protein
MIDKIKEDIKINNQSFPFLSHFWEIGKIDDLNDDNAIIKFGHIGTKSFNSTPFYKPFSKIIDFSKIDD